MRASGASPDGEQGALVEASALSPDFRLPRQRRVHASAVFREAFEQGVRQVGRVMVMCLRAGEDADLRLGVVAAKRTFRKAVERARAKRLLREAFRLNRYKFGDRRDVILIARRRILDASLREVEKDLLRLAGRAGVLRDDG